MKKIQYKRQDILNYNYSTYKIPDGTIMTRLRYRVGQGLYSQTCIEKKAISTYLSLKNLRVLASPTHHFPISTED